MNVLDKYQAKKIRKRIEIKQNNLKILLPEINFLQFIDQLEQFQQIIEGIDTDDPAAQVQLPLVRSRFEALQKSYISLVNTLADYADRVKQRPSDLLLKHLSESVDESTLYLTTNFHNFQSNIESSCSFLYNLRAILIVRNLLSDLRAEVKIVEKNFHNVRKSTTKRQVKNTLTRLYTVALATTSFKFENLARSFPNFAKLIDQRLRFKRININMDGVGSKTDLKQIMPQLNGQTGVLNERDETTEEDFNKQPVIAFEASEVPEEEDNQRYVVGERTPVESEVNHEAEELTSGKAGLDETEHDIKDENKPDDDQTTEQAEELPTGKIIEETLDVVTGQSNLKLNNTLTASVTSSFIHLKEELQNEIDRQKREVANSLLELSDLENKIKEISKTMEHYRHTLKSEIEEIEILKRRISDDTDLLEEEKAKKLQDYGVQIGQMTGLNEERLQELEIQKNEYKTRLLEKAAILCEMKKNLDAKMQQFIGNLNSAYSGTTTEVERLKIQRTLQNVERMYRQEFNIFDTIEEIESFQVDDDGVYYHDKTNTKIYLTALGLAKLLDKNAGLTLYETEMKTEELSEASVSAKTLSNVPSLASYSRKTASRSMPCSSAGSSRTTHQDTGGQQPLDSESYIKNTLGKPLRQALAAITIYQPSDPINYLANYLLQYRYNELRNIQRHQEFENLVVERERYAKHVQRDNIRQEMQNMQRSDTCNLPPTAKF